MGEEYGERLERVTEDVPNIFASDKLSFRVRGDGYGALYDFTPYIAPEQSFLIKRIRLGNPLKRPFTVKTYPQAKMCLAGDALQLMIGAKTYLSLPLMLCSDEWFPIDPALRVLHGASFGCNVGVVAGRRPKSLYIFLGGMLRRPIQ